MTPDEIRAESEILYYNHEADIVARQDAFFAEYGKYFQGLRTHTANIPADGEKYPPDNLENMPTDQPIPWPVDDFPSEMIAALQIDVCNSPQGQGWTSRVTVYIDGKLNMKSIGYGACGITHDWIKEN